DNVLAQIEDNQWLGRDLLLWLVHQTMNASSEYVVSQPGPIGKGAGFVAYINDKICLQGADDNGPQKVTVSGFQDRFEEVQTALKNGKTISEATIFFEYNDSVWKVSGFFKDLGKLQCFIQPKTVRDSLLVLTLPLFVWKNSTDRGVF
ncbi:MAG: hypothetical protein PHC98_02885, partial [Syntrophotalea acetylenica]|nr:hypothetical protein [Syntrophotalea acetylenica]